MSGIRSRGRRGSVVVPNWRTEDPGIDPYAFRIACWLASTTVTPSIARPPSCRCSIVA